MGKPWLSHLHELEVPQKGIRTKDLLARLAT
jgi:hypothetical protein